MQMPSWWTTTKDHRTFQFDPCIQDEMIELIYTHKIRTLNSCCGHNGQAIRSVVVAMEDVDKMLALGYVQLEEVMDTFRPEIFHMKSEGCKEEQ